ncbi:p-hydroxybenzoic acid efflux pump subunit AaeB [mine drainage metagenome]|uniref:p-hydroxybenzoic acid efflux pump subunit AaeB n=1 Tax=mine drainage metagenome TaxID=410659 RepID=A0A1J5SN70_9ZZZZ
MSTTKPPLLPAVLLSPIRLDGPGFPGPLRVLKDRLLPWLGLSAPASSWLFALRTALAAVLALYLAFALQLDNAFSAATTVMIVANPLHGLVWGKMINRALGTLLGGLAALGLTAAFGQSPVLFLAAFGLWMGLCTAASTLLRSFRSYGAVLAGYTVGLIAFPHLPAHPDDIFTLVTGRVSAVLLGIACSTLVSSLFSSRNGAQMLEARLRALLAELLERMQSALLLPPQTVPSQAERLERGRLRHQTRNAVMALDGLVECAAAEGTRPAGVIEAQRASVAALSAALTTLAGVEDAILALNVGPEAPLRTHLATLAARLPVLAETLRHAPSPDLPAAIAQARRDLAATRATLENGLRENAVGTDASGRPVADFARLRLLGQSADLFDDLEIALGGLTGLLLGQTGAGAPDRSGFHLEWRWSGINGLRAAAATWLASLLWIITAWPSGGMMVGGVVPNVGLLSLRDRPDLDAMQLAKGITLAMASGFLYLLFVLPWLDGFPMLALALVPPLMWGTLQTVNPRRTFIGVGFLVFFITLLGPRNPMSYNVMSYLNIGLATVCSAVIAALVHRVVLPVSPTAHIRGLLAVMRADLERLARPRLALAGAWAGGWESRMNDRLLKLAARVRAAELPAAPLLPNAHGALRLGREILRLRQMTADPRFPDRRAGAVVLHALAPALAGGPPRPAVRACRLAARRLERLAYAAEAGAADQRADLRRAAASLVEIALLLGRHRRFFQEKAAQC